MSDLPSYNSPPVNEVVLAVAFADLPGLTIAHLGHLWFSEFRAELPLIEEQAPYDPPIESMGSPAPAVLSFQWSPPALSSAVGSFARRQPPAPAAARLDGLQLAT